MSRTKQCKIDSFWKLLRWGQVFLSIDSICVSFSRALSVVASFFQLTLFYYWINSVLCGKFRSYIWNDLQMKTCRIFLFRYLKRLRTKKQLNAMRTWTISRPRLALPNLRKGLASRGRETERLEATHTKYWRTSIVKYRSINNRRESIDMSETCSTSFYNFLILQDNPCVSFRRRIFLQGNYQFPC